MKIRFYRFGKSVIYFLLMTTLLEPSLSAPDTMTQLYNFGSMGLRNLRKLTFGSFLPSNEVEKTSIAPEIETYNQEFSSDDLFSGLSELWNDEQIDKSNSNEVNKKINLDEAIVANISFAKPFEVQNNDKDVSISSSDSKKIEESYQPIWNRLKMILANMKSALQELNDENTAGLDGVYDTIDRVIDFGDKVNLVENIKESFDPELLDFLQLKWNDTKNQFVHQHPILQGLMGITGLHLPKSLTYTVIKYLSKFLHNQAFIHLHESNFVINLMKASGFKANEIREVFLLLDIPFNSFQAADENNSELSDSIGQGRQYGRYDYDVERTSGYGNTQPSYGGSGGGYGMMSNFDPFVLLAGLAFATFAAYIIYRLLSSTMRRKRSIDVDELALDFSDIPVILENVYSWIGKAEQKYGDKQEHPIERPITDTISDQANQLWLSFKADRFSKSCLRRFLCENIQNSAESTLDAFATLNTLSLTTLSTIFGSETSPNEVDSLMTKVLEGEDLHCSVSQCDDILYQDVINYQIKNRKKDF